MTVRTLRAVPLKVVRRRRLVVHLAFAALVWPALTLLGTAINLTRTPYFALKLAPALAAAAVGLAIDGPDVILAGALLFGFGIWTYRRFGVTGQPVPMWRLVLEPFALFLALLSGIAVWYPATLAEPLFTAVHQLPAFMVVLVLYGLVAGGAFLTGMSGRRLRLAACLSTIGLLCPAALSVRAMIDRFTGHPPTIVLLGIDSVSRVDDLSAFHDWVAARRGTWYEYAVSPGLLTNAVWSSILTMQPVSSHGVFHTFQNLWPEASKLLAVSKAEGYRSISVFGDQLTCAVGSTAGFDEDRSGPIGWRQIVLPVTANSSFLIPIIRPLLPRAWISPLLPNQPGTYSYDVRREIREVFGAGYSAERTIVAAHLTYPHLPAYPRSIDLRMDELKRIALSRSGDVRDRSFDWKDVDLPSDPIPLRAWKVKHLFESIKIEVEEREYFQGGGKLVVFTDHGSRAGLTMENFTDRRYHHVLFATFGIQARCEATPISLTDVGSLLGFSKSTSQPIVEYANTPAEEWLQLARTARIRWSGEVELNSTLLGRAFSHLRSYSPWPEMSGPCAERVGSSRISIGPLSAQETGRK